MGQHPIRSRADAIAPQLVTWRRELHRRPELGFDVHETSDFVAARLGELDLEVRRGIAETGLVAILRSPSPRGPGVLLRADMDALPVQEVEGREYGSEVPGRMHACGHDGHMAMLLGAATLLSERRDELPHDVLFCFQPAEEGGGGGRRMVEEGVLDIVETGSVYALHLWSEFPTGTIQVRPGPTLAAQDEFRAVIRGRGGHGAVPHRAIDPVVAACQAVSALQAVVSRHVDPMQAAVVTVSSLAAGTGATNIIPDEARLAGTLRSFDEGVRELLRERVHRVLEATASGAGCELDWNLTKGYPAVVNALEPVRRVQRIAAAVVGEDNVVEPAPMAASEDFSYFLQQRPGAFVFVGMRDESRGLDAPHHSPRFDVDESMLPRGAELLARIALDAG